MPRPDTIEHPDVAPMDDWTGEVFARAAFWHRHGLIRPPQCAHARRGRPRLANPKRQITLRLDAEILDRFRETGPGWQGRINAALRAVLKT
jgi:uncharacterized protein (DUF4415 family)